MDTCIHTAIVLLKQEKNAHVLCFLMTKLIYAKQKLASIKFLSMGCFVVLGFYFQPTAKVKRRRDLGLKSFRKTGEAQDRTHGFSFTRRVA